MDEVNIREVPNRIPKIIHYSWFSGEEFPDDIKECMSTWKKVLPDYQFVLWDAQKLAELNNTFANESVSVHKWAFASDFVRLYAVYTYGGIWLDTDIEMYKSFDPFLCHRMFIGREGNEDWVRGGASSYSLLTSHCFGAEPGHPFLKECLAFYETRHFIRTKEDFFPEDLRYDMIILPVLQARIAEMWGYKGGREHDRLQVLKEGLIIYPHDFFDMPKYKGMNNVICIHRQFGGWRTGNKGYFKSYESTHDMRYVNTKRILIEMLAFIDKILVNFHIKIIPY